MSAANADSFITSPSVPVSCTLPDPGTTATSTSRTSPPAAVQASPHAIPNRSVPSSRLGGRCAGGPSSSRKCAASTRFRRRGAPPSSSVAARRRPAWPAGPAVPAVPAPSPLAPCSSSPAATDRASFRATLDSRRSNSRTPASRVYSAITFCTASPEIPGDHGSIPWRFTCLGQRNRRAITRFSVSR